MSGTTTHHSDVCHAQYGIDLPQFGAADMNVPTFRTLTTYSWEQSDMLVKIYVPLRGVQTDLLRWESGLRQRCATELGRRDDAQAPLLGR